MGPDGFAAAFETEEEYGRHLERLRWPDGICCIYCTYPRVALTTVNRSKGSTNRVIVPARRIFQCGNSECRRQFSTTSGTLFHKTRVPLGKWFRAITALRAGPVRVLTLQRELGLSYQTAWYLRKRIGDALRSGEDFLPPWVPDDHEEI
jgi:hypothetical protein